MDARMFGNDYLVEEILGEGSFGVVYRCHDRKLNRTVALKKLKTGIAGDRELPKFMDEARRMASLVHENLIQVHFLDEDVPFIVMEYFPGRTLREIPAEEPLTAVRSLKIMRQVAAGLQALHEVGVVHRDLSTNNVMVDESDRVKILDLGLSRDIRQVSETMSREDIAGTLKYMAPEVIDGKPPTPAIDFFSFGVILYELLSGCHPFEAEHFMSVFYNIVDKLHRPLAEIVPDVPEAATTLVDQCLAKDPAERLTDWSVVIDRLDLLLSTPDLEVTRALPAEALPRRRSGRFRNPYLNRVMIQRASDFFGRRQEVMRIYSRLDATPPGSVSVVGDRKTGKSSLLNFVYMKQTRQRNLEDPSATIMVFVDLQRQKSMSLATFVDTVLGIANLELGDRMDVSDCPHDLQGIEQFVERLHNDGLRFVLLMDEFEAITTNPNFDLEFFSFLRYLANHYNVAYVTSSARDLQELCHTKEIRDSPFFNIFSPLPLSVFREEEARELIRGPSADSKHPLEPHEGRILEMAGLFPFFLQVACCHALEYMVENEADEPDFGEIQRRFYEEARLHYRFMWDTFEEHERSAILRVAEGRRIPDALRDVCEELQGRHYLQTENGQPVVFSSSFQGFLSGEVSARRPRGLLQRLLRFGDHS